MVTKSSHEYVRFEDHPIVVDDLRLSSEHIKAGIDTAFAARELQAQKHADVEAAKQKVGELLKELERLNSLMMRKAFGTTLEKRHLKPVIYREKKKTAQKQKVTAEERDALIRGEFALKNLQKNLEMLKKQIR